jgi:hypothetical protein
MTDFRNESDSTRTSLAALTGYARLRAPRLNKGSAFTLAERSADGDCRQDLRARTGQQRVCISGYGYTTPERHCSAHSRLRVSPCLSCVSGGRGAARVPDCQRRDHAARRSNANAFRSGSVGLGSGAHSRCLHFPHGGRFRTTHRSRGGNTSRYGIGYTCRRWDCLPGDACHGVRTDSSQGLFRAIFPALTGRDGRDSCTRCE